MGSPNTDDFIDANSKVEFAHRMALISDITYNVMPLTLNGYLFCIVSLSSCEGRQAIADSAS